MPSSAADSLRDRVAFKAGATAAVAVLTGLACALLAQRAIAHQRGVTAGALQASGDPAGAWARLLRSARAPGLARLNASPLLHLGDAAAWAMDDPAFLRYHEDLSPRALARTAFAAYAEALRRRPTSSTAWAGLADLFRRLGELRRREEPVDVAAPPPGPGSPEGLVVETAYRRAIEMEPANYFWYAYLADLLKDRRRDEALALYTRAVELMPDLGWHYYLGTAGPLAPEMFGAVRAGLERALEVHPFARDRIESNLGYLHERQRDYDEALRHYRRAIELAADPSPYLYQAGVVLKFQGQTAEAIEYLKRAEARGTLSSRLSGAALLQIGRLLLDRGDSAEAAGYLARARSSDPGSYTARLELGRALHAIGQSVRAEEEARQAMSLDSARPQAYQLLVQIYRDRGDAAQAIPLARRLIEMDPMDHGYREQLDALYRDMEVR